MSYESTTHKLNLTGNEISTVLYLVDDFIEGNEYRLSDPDFKSYVDRIYAELQSVTDNYYAQHENDYAECVDHLVNTMEVNSWKL